MLETEQKPVIDPAVREAFVARLGEQAVIELNIPDSPLNPKVYSGIVSSVDESYLTLTDTQVQGPDARFKVAFPGMELHLHLSQVKLL